MRSLSQSETVQGTEAPPAVVPLDSRRALSAEVAGAKASALAVAANAGLPVLPGIVVTTAATERFETPAVTTQLAEAWSKISGDGQRSVVVRSSSTIEDSGTSSMAGMFTSVLDVAGREAFLEAVGTVIASGNVVPLSAPPTDGGGRAPAPMAVLVQPYLAALAGGVMFGVDPVTGRTDRVVVAASSQGASAVVGGEVDATRYVLSRTGRLIETQGDDPGPGGRPLLSRRQLRALARLGKRAQKVFGGPQDIEWAIDTDGELWLLQSRPITAVGNSAQATGPVLGPGPVAETFPEPLSALEEDLWAEPLRNGLKHALVLGGTVSRRRIASSPVVASVGGRLAADLELLGVSGGRKSLLGRIDPRPGVRRLVAAWRVGRLRAALPDLAADLVDHADTELLSVSRLDELSDRQLLRILGRSGQALTALHGHEVLMGWLVAESTASTTAASVAMRILAQARSRGLSDAEIVARYPSVLALVPPRVRGDAPDLPATPEVLPLHTAGTGERSAVLREALRLRARWVQELTSSAAWELAARLTARGVLASAEYARHLTLDELRTAVRTGKAPADLPQRRGDSSPPLPARFRLTPDGAVVAMTDDGTGDRGTGAGGGRRSGVVHHGEGEPPPGSVLVVRTLEPGLAPLLPALAGLVAETGSPLSHLAILARELGVATAVGVPGAVGRFAPGKVVVVDGTTGEVATVDDDTEPARTVGAA